MMVATGVPPVIAAISLGFMSNLFGSITHFGSGQAAVYYGAGGPRASVSSPGRTLKAAASWAGGGHCGAWNSCQPAGPCRPHTSMTCCRCCYHKHGARA
jgi:hypothetical protein